MDEFEQLFNNIVDKSVFCDLNPGVEVINNKTEIEVFIDHAIPTDNRQNRRSSRLRSIYPRKFPGDHFNISIDTFVDEIRRIINAHDFNDITHLRNSKRFVFTYVIQINGEIVAQTH